MIELKYITRSQIDIIAWDNCISKCKFPLIYATTLYLDKMCGRNWDAVVANDYSLVFPLPWRKKYNIKYAYQPPFIQQLGIFSFQNITDSIAQECIALLQENIKFAEYTFNANNQIEFVKEKVKLRKNYILPLFKPYETIFENFKTSFKTNLKRIKKFNLQYETSSDAAAVIELYQNLYSTRIKSITSKDYNNFLALCLELQRRGQVIIRKVSFQDELLSIVLLLKDGNRLYNIMSCVTEAGKKKRSNYFLLDQLIKEFCNSPLSLDLEGSDIKGIEDFFKTMNPQLEEYPFLKYNHLPAVVKLFKP